MEIQNIDFLVKGNNVYIVEICELNRDYYVYANYGKTLHKHLRKRLLHTLPTQDEAETAFNAVISKKLKNGYRFLQKGEHIQMASNNINQPPVPSVTANKQYRKIKV